MVKNITNNFDEILHLFPLRKLQSRTALHRNRQKCTYAFIRSDYASRLIWKAGLTSFIFIVVNIVRHVKQTLLGNRQERTRFSQIQTIYYRVRLIMRIDRFLNQIKSLYTVIHNFLITPF